MFIKIETNKIISRMGTIYKFNTCMCDKKNIFEYKENIDFVLHFYNARETLKIFDTKKETMIKKIVAIECEKKSPTKIENCLKKKCVDGDTDVDGGNGHNAIPK